MCIGCLEKPGLDREDGDFKFREMFRSRKSITHHGFHGAFKSYLKIFDTLLHIITCMYNSLFEDGGLVFDS